MECARVTYLSRTLSRLQPDSVSVPSLHTLVPHSRSRVTKTICESQISLNPDDGVVTVVPQTPADLSPSTRAPHILC